MAPTTTQAHLPALGQHARDEIGNELQATLVELIDLALVGKQLHWSVVGALFRPLHLQLDELINTWRELADSVAERAVTIGFWPDGQAHTVAQSTENPLVDRGAVQDHVVLQKLAKRLAEVDESVRGRMDRLGELDVASQDVLVDVVRALEEQLWMIRSQLTHGS